MKLLGISFVNDGREIPPELDEASVVECFDVINSENDITAMQLSFWEGFVKYCKQKGRNDISSRKPLGQNWYDVPVSAPDFILSYTLTYGKFLSLLIYAYDTEVFNRLEAKKDIIENAFGDSLDWYSSREKSVAKRIIYKKEADVFNPNAQENLYEWMIENFDKLQKALDTVGEKYN